MMRWGRRQRRHSDPKFAIGGLIALAVVIAVNQFWPDISELLSKTAARPSIATGVARIVDGDTLELDGAHIRLWGIDAPEARQTCQDSKGDAYPCGREATAALRALAEGKQVECTKRGRDAANRLVAVCRTAAGEINQAMVRRGWAIDFTYVSAGAYQGAQRAAKAERLGLWQGQFELPMQWRREHPQR